MKIQMIKYFLFLFVMMILSCETKQNKSFKSENNYDVLPDSILKIKLEQINIEDQTLRFLLPDVAERFGKGSKEEKFFWKLMQKQDSLCINKVEDIIKNYGWLGKNRIGEKANQTLWLVIQHAELETQEKYLPLLKKSVDDGESQGWHYAFLKDRILMRNNKKQIYGTQAKWNKDSLRMEIYQIEDIKNVNNRRKKLGLETVEEYAKNNSYYYNPENNKSKRK